MAIGEKLWEGKAKTAVTGLIKSVGVEGVKSEYSWTAQVKGVGRAKGVDGNIHVTAMMKMPPKGVCGLPLISLKSSWFIVVLSAFISYGIAYYSLSTLFEKNKRVTNRK